MFNKVTIDILFNLLLIFLSLFFLSFVLINPEEKKPKTTVENSNDLIIVMSWETNNDMDLWLLLPNGNKVGYSNRDAPPAHLDIDVVAWRTYDPEGRSPMYPGDMTSLDKDYIPPENSYIIKKNEEVITIRDIVEGHYIVNVHYFNPRSYKHDPIRVSMLIQDVKNNKIIYAGHKIISTPRDEVHFVSFDVDREHMSPSFRIININTTRPEYFLK